MRFEKDKIEVQRLQESILDTLNNDTIEKSIEELIRLQSQLIDSGGQTEEDSVEKLKELQASLNDSGGNEWVGRAKILTQILAMYGIAKISELIDANNRTFPEQFKLAITRLANAHTANEIFYARESAQQGNYRDAKLDIFNGRGINSMNRWRVDFLDNNTLSSFQNSFLSESCTEFSMEGMQITTAKQDLVFEKHEDVSDIQLPTNCVFTFMIDRRLLVKRIIEKVVNQMRSFRTGRYGYKDDYKWKRIRVTIYDTMNNEVRRYYLHDCIISGVSELTMNLNASEFQSCQMTVSFSKMSFSSL